MVLNRGDKTDKELYAETNGHFYCRLRVIRITNGIGMTYVGECVCLYVCMCYIKEGWSILNQSVIFCTFQKNIFHFC